MFRRILKVAVVLAGVLSPQGVNAMAIVRGRKGSELHMTNPGPFGTTEYHSDGSDDSTILCFKGFDALPKDTAFRVQDLVGKNYPENFDALRKIGTKHGIEECKSNSKTTIVDNPLVSCVSKVAHNKIKQPNVETPIVKKVKYSKNCNKDNVSSAPIPATFTEQHMQNIQNMQSRRMRA